jgi:hypothetical protein
MNQTLRDELLQMAKEDQDVRRELLERGELFKGYHPQMEELHQRNNQRLNEIADIHGWPGKDLVGEDGASAAFLIVQHAISMPSLMRRCLPLMQQAAQNNDLDAQSLAYLEDRIRLMEGRSQRYGTQYDWDDDGQMSPCPIEEPDTVNERRAQVGLDTLEENITRIRSSLEKEQAPTDRIQRKEEFERWRQRVGWL